MQDKTNYQELARRFGLEAASQSVLQLTQLVARQDCTIEEIAKVISRDAGLQKRLLRVANPEAQNESEYTIDTVEGALMRNGIGCALLVAMGTPLAGAIVKTFQTMLSIKLESADVHKVPPFGSELLLGAIGFRGKAEGSVYLRLSLDSGKVIAARIFGLQPSDSVASNEIDDAVGEVLNIIAGNFKSNLCDAGLDCRLETPQVTRTRQFSVPKGPRDGLERMAFCAAQLVLCVDVTVNPWNG
ncbi:MAG: chemotaxis protein CheX [Verrucomicrobiota bacterium]|jgi:chemotaxis protein CheX